MMRKLLATALVLLATPALAADWTYDSVTPAAYVDNGIAQFQFVCRGGDFTVGYWVRTPHPQVAASSTLNLALVPDPAKGSSASNIDGARFAQEIPLLHVGGASMIIRGPVAKAWASLAQKAKTTLRVAYVRKTGATEVFDSHDFGAGGSAIAIRNVLERCG